MASDFEALCEVVREQVGDDTIAWGMFRVADSAKDSPRRVVWIPADFRCEQPYEANPIRHSDSGALGDTLLVDRTTVICIITGVDFEDACLIRRQVLNACRVSLGTSSIPLDGEYVTEQEGQSGYLWGGAAKIVQRFDWMINVPRVAPYMAPDGSGYEVIVTQIDQTNEIQTDAPAVTEDTFSIT